MPIQTEEEKKMFVGTDAAVREWKNRGKLRASNHRRNYEDHQKLKRIIWATITLKNYARPLQRRQ